jgi:predicted RNase H-like nuclease (RuvC/YqgF family)
MGMKAKAVVISLVIICLGLAVVLIVGMKKYKEEKKTAEQTRVDLSNNWSFASADLAKQRKFSMELETNVVTLTGELNAKSNEVVSLRANLAKTEADAKTAAQTAREELAKRDARITELETSNEDYNKRMSELNVSISGLQNQISSTEKKLKDSEGDREFLLGELKRLQTEKSNLEKQLNNLAFLRDQVRKIRDDLSIARRLEWIRRGLYGTTSVKGGERLVHGFTQPAATPQTNYNLNVELRQDGTVKVGAPTTNAPATNAPATNAPPPK